MMYIDILIDMILGVQSWLTVIKKVFKRKHFKPGLEGGRMTMLSVLRVESTLLVTLERKIIDRVYRNSHLTETLNTVVKEYIMFEILIR